MSINIAIKSGPPGVYTTDNLPMDKPIGTIAFDSTFTVPRVIPTTN